MWFRTTTRRLTLPRPEGPAKRWGRGAPGLVRRAVRVVEVIRETERAATVVLEPDDGRPLPFCAGQYLTHLFHIGGQVVKRAYSLSSPEGGRLAFTAKAIDGGVASAFILDQLRPDYRYEIIGPSGEFVLEADDSVDLGFVAGGSGITPVISLIETALARNPGRRVRLVYANRSEHDIVFAERLRQLCARHPSLEVTHVLSRPGNGKGSYAGRVNAERLTELLGPAPGMRFYLCGPLGLMDVADAALRAAGIAPAHIHRERFYAAPRAVHARPTETQLIEFTRTGKSVTQRPGESILEAGLREGVPLSFSCTVGGCASCKLKVTQGEFALNEPNCLTPEERAAGFTLACSAFALGPLQIDA